MKLSIIVPAYNEARTLAGRAEVVYGAHLTDAPTCYECFRTEVIRAITIEHDSPPRLTKGRRAVYLL